MWAGACLASFPPAWRLFRLPSQVWAGHSPTLQVGGWQWGEQGTRGGEGVPLQGEVVLLEEAAAHGRQEKAGQRQLTRGWASLLGQGGNREGGAARADQGLFSQLAFAFKFVLSMYIFTEVAQGLLLFLHFST